MKYPDDLEKAITARNYKIVTETIKGKKAAIAGLGGLGSNIAVMLTRLGIGELLLIDFDTVEPSNLNRQFYNTTHLGMLKTDALKSQLVLINPFVKIETKAIKITDDNVLDVFKDCPIVCEAFDNPVYKAILVNALLQNTDTKVVAASGMAGYSSANSIKTAKKLNNLYVCGDSVPADEGGIGLMAPRVMICAAHQANMILRLLLGIEEE